MRCKRMRGYGSWCLGWKEGERASNRPSNNDNGGCGTTVVVGFILIVAFSFFKVAIESGNGLAFILGLAVIAGLMKSR